MIGAGGIVRVGHVPALRRAGVEVVAVCDPNRARARSLAATLGVPHAFGSHHELLALDGLDLVTIGSPNVFHAPVAIDALRSGRHVLCEKPIATRSADARRMVAEARRRGLLLGVNQHMRFDPSARLMREAVESGSLGDVYFADVRLARQSGIPGFGSWFTRRELAGAGALFDIGVHMLDLGLWLLGFPPVERVRGTLAAHLGVRGVGRGEWGDDRRRRGTFDVDDTAIASLALAGGAVLRMHVSWASFGPEEERVTLHGTRGGADRSAQLHGRSRPLRLYAQGADGAVVETVPALPRGNHWFAGIEQFVRAVRGEEPLAVDPSEPVEVLRLLEKIATSSERGVELAV
ncbi:MAG: Gfo/Idh/MocA family protein [Gaiella sp.]